MSSYLVTGAAGFIGSKVTAQLLAEGHTVVGVDNLNDYYDTRLKLYRLSELAKNNGCAKQFNRKVRKDFKLKQEWLLSILFLSLPIAVLITLGVVIIFNEQIDFKFLAQILTVFFIIYAFYFFWVIGPRRTWSTAKGKTPVILSSPHFYFYPLDIEEKQFLTRLFKQHKFDAVIHLAARAGVRASMENPLAYFQTNTTGTLNLLEVMRLHNVRKFVFASTSSLYAGQPTPFSEDLPVNTPVSPYAATKKAAEVLAYTYHKLYGFDVTILRYFTVFGPAGRPDMSVLRFIQALDTGKPLEIFGDGTQTRDWTYIDDIVRGTIAAAQTPLGFEIINLGGGTRPPVALNEVIAFLEKDLAVKAIRHEVPFHAADMDTTSADISKALRLLQWEPRVTWQEGLHLTVLWYRENREWLRQITF
jgi:nucleoside-diphosphate-sugar epimerase